MLSAKVMPLKDDFPSEYTSGGTPINRGM